MEVSVNYIYIYKVFFDFLQIILQNKFSTKKQPLRYFYLNMSTYIGEQIELYIESQIKFINNLNKDVFSALVDFELTDIRTPRA